MCTHISRSRFPYTKTSIIPPLGPNQLIYCLDINVYSSHAVILLEISGDKQWKSNAAENISLLYASIMSFKHIFYTLKHWLLHTPMCMGETQSLNQSLLIFFLLQLFSVGIWEAHARKSLMMMFYFYYHNSFLFISIHTNMHTEFYLSQNIIRHQVSEENGEPALSS